MLSSHNFENSIIYCSLHSLEGIISSETVSIQILVSDLGVGNSQQAALLFFAVCFISRLCLIPTGRVQACPDYLCIGNI